ncbi:MAG: hypothetical protein A2138_21080 [Deltaproteobacteria bacterium RBG_16_71_12]|nr:MAG: hypothetical protein A2138_21080 [Deltaproteobacteria bacterium RBG_16_71_12]
MDDVHRQLRFADATQQMVETILKHDDPAVVLEHMVHIVGETLALDRALIYDVSLRDDQAVGLCEWLNPAIEVSATKATYPLSLFRAAAETVLRTRAPHVSHESAPSPELVKDGADRLLHGDMAIKSLYWHPFAFRDDGLYLLAFNQVQDERRFDAMEVAFVERVASYVSLALQKIHLIDERRRAEQAVLDTQKLESVGLLAGGIAHDFNNLLVGVVGAADVALASLDAESPTRPIVERILHSGRLAADLAAQLLVYAGRAPSRIERIDVAALAGEMIALLRVSMWKEVELLLDAVDPGERTLFRQIGRAEPETEQTREQRLADGSSGVMKRANTSPRSSAQPLAVADARHASSSFGRRR